MKLKINNITYYFILASFIAMALPYLFDFGGGVFKNDFYAKRVMTLFTFPFLLLILFFIKEKITININIAFYIILFVVILIDSIIFGNKISLFVLDAFIVLLPVFFYLLVYKTGFKIELFIDKIPKILVIASVLVLIEVKLQFSYLTMLAIIYIIFFSKANYKVIHFLLVEMIYEVS